MDDNLRFDSELKWLFDYNNPSTVLEDAEEYCKIPSNDSYSDFLSPLESSVGGPTFENLSRSSSTFESKVDQNSCINENEFESNDEYYLPSNSDNLRIKSNPSKNHIIERHNHINYVIHNVINKRKTFESQNYSYNIIKLLGYGYYGTVFLSKMKLKDDDDSSYRLVAIKMINFEQIKTDNYNDSGNDNTIVDIIDQLNDEINILVTMNYHTNVINYIESFYIYPHYLAFVTDYISGYTLRDIYKSYGTFSENLICFVCEPILEVLNILSCHNYRYKRIHKDIKSNNIMIDYNTCQIKLLDFGVSQILDSVLYHTPKISSGTLQWMSPELIQSRDYDHLTDIWSLGITLLELSTGHIPNIYEIFLVSNESNENISINLDKVKHENTLEMYIKLLTKEIESCGKSNITQTQDSHQIIQRNSYIINKIKSFSKQYYDFLNSMLTINSSKRPNSSRLLVHPFITSKKKSVRIFNNNFQNIERELYHFNNSFNLTEFLKEKIISRIFPRILNSSNYLSEEEISSSKKLNMVSKSMEKINFNYIQEIDQKYGEKYNIKFSFSDDDEDNNNSQD
ncbi:Ser/Thr protein kinase [Cryptosporidium canis]|uniref:non-specific serine/threonine protein kinase n=1 Tax=Cryptosporidium canis TaxID=195482 RepID=A0ABQ8PC93_9CRYT|nr:Ser/Thr protein kinase [Cryptosporidium canis]KAJ1614190.1 Ser/Thr protein kinase [Cryptosporidium canis]